MSEVNVSVLKPNNPFQKKDQTMDQTVKVFLDAFKKEAFTKTFLDLSRRANYDMYFQAVKYKLSLYQEVGHQVFVARKGGVIIGTFFLRSPHISTPLGLQLRRLLPYLPAFTRLIIRYLQAAHLASAVKPPDKLPKKHYTLEGLAVYPAHQGKGVGRLMLEKADQVCTEDNTASGIYLYTGNEKNKEIYKRFSYHVLETRPNRLFTAYHMFKINDTSNSPLHTFQSL